MNALVVERENVRCMDCSVLLRVGAFVSERLIGMLDDEPVVEEVCLACAGAPT